MTLLLFTLITDNKEDDEEAGRLNRVTRCRLWFHLRLLMSFLKMILNFVQIFLF